MALIVEQTKQEKKLLSMANDISSNLQNPLSMLSDLSAKFEHHLDAKQQQIQKNALTRINTITKDLLPKTATSIKNDNIENKKQPLGYFLGISFQQTMQEKKMQYTSKQLQLSMQIDQDAWFVFSTFPENDFYRILSNLISNAIEACENSSVKQVICHLHFQKGSRHLQLSVKDSGCGMSQQQIDNILLGKGQTTKKTGHGIGLRYVVDTIKSWQGKCDIKSTKDKGTDFTITIPATDPPPTWLTSTIHLPKQGHIIIFDNDIFYHQLWSDILSPYLASTNTLSLIHCYSKEDLIQTISPQKNQLIIFDTALEQDPLADMQYISQHKQQQRIFYATQQFQHRSIQIACKEHDILLLPKPLVPKVKIEMEV